MKNKNSNTPLRRRTSWWNNAALVVASLALASGTQAQVATAYAFSQAAGTYTAITGGTQLATYTGTSGAASMDDVIYNIPGATIPFTFTYDGVGYTGCNVSSNGFITFGATAPSTSTYVPISSTTAYAGAISAFGRDLQGGYAMTADRTTGSPTLTNVSMTTDMAVGDIISGSGIPAATTVTAIAGSTVTMSANATTTATAGTVTYGGAHNEIRYETLGSAPNRVFVVQWKGFRRFGTTITTTGNLRLNFQIRLFEDNNKIEVVYGDCTPGVSTFTTVNQVGLRGPNSSFATNVNNRLNVKGTNDNWINSAAGTANTSGMLFNSVAPANVIANGLTYSWELPACTPPTATASTTINCGAGTYTVTVDLTSLGDAADVDITSTANGGVIPGGDNVGTGMYTTPAITLGTSTNITVVHNGDPLCNEDLGTFVQNVTDCPITSYPYCEDFDAFATCSTSSTCTTVCPLENGWNNVNTSTWRTDAGTTPSSGTGPTNDHTSGTAAGQYLYIEASTVCADRVATSPLFDISGLANGAEFSVWYHMFGAQTGTFSVEVEDVTNNPGVFDPAISVSGDQGDQWNFSGWVSLSAYTGSVRFRVTGTNAATFAGDMAFDDFCVRELPSCAAPTAVMVSGVTATDATISWTCATCTGGYIVEYGPSGFTPGNDGTAGGGTIWTGASVPSSPVTITGLSSSTEYDVYVREECTLGEFSANSSAASFSTACGGTSCTYTARIGDIFGDGWDGTQWVVKENGITLVVLGPQIVGCGDGGTGPVDVPFNVCEGSTLTFEWTVLGGFTGEKALQFYDASNTLIYDHRGTSTSTNCGGVNWTSANSAGTLGVKYTGTSNCAPPACVAPTATATVVPACPGGFSVDVNISDFGETLSVPATSATINYSVNSVAQTPIPVATTGTTTLTGFANGDDVDITVSHESDMTCDATFNNNTFTCPPANDLCADAISVNCNTITNASTVNSSTTGAPTGCADALTTAGGIWYTVAGFDGTMTVDLSGSSYDTKLGIFTGSCGALVCVDSDDDGGTGLTSLVTFTGSSAQTYYIYVTGFSTNTGSVTMFVSCGDNNNACTESGLAIEFQTDNAPNETTWDLLDATGQFVIVSGGPLAAPGALLQEFACVPDGCYQFRVNDSGGNGMGTGGYVVRTQGTNIRIIDNANNFNSGAVSQSGEAFCLPLGDVELLYTSCDKYFWANGEYIVCNEDAAVAADYNGGGAAGADSGYDFYFFDPNGSYSYVRSRRHNVSDNYANVGSTRTCHMKINNWAAANHIPDGLKLNVRVRPVVNGVVGAYGPTCRFTRDEALANCPPTKLFDVPGFPQFYSCGVNRNFVNNTANRLYARPVGGATQYRFTFNNAELVTPIVRVVSTYYVNLGWSIAVAPPLVAGQSYDVTVEAFKGGVFCVAGEVCVVTINNAFAGGQQNVTLDGGSALNMWPNPNNGDVLNMSLRVADPFINTVSMDIFDLSGKRMIARTVGIQDGTINTTIDLNGDLAVGMYMVKVTAGEEVFTQRVVIQK